MSTLMSGAKMLLECLVREGVDCIFGYPGGVTLPFYDVLYEHHIRHVLVRHEENAAFAAACEKAGLTFIGPPASVIARLGSKVAARYLMAGSSARSKASSPRPAMTAACSFVPTTSPAPPW